MFIPLRQGPIETLLSRVYRLRRVPRFRVTPKPVNARPYTIARGALRRLVAQQRAEPGSIGGKDSPAANAGAKLSLRTKNSRRSRNPKPISQFSW